MASVAGADGKTAEVIGKSTDIALGFVAPNPGSFTGTFKMAPAFAPELATVGGRTFSTTVEVTVEGKKLLEVNSGIQMMSAAGKGGGGKDDRESKESKKTESSKEKSDQLKYEPTKKHQEGGWGTKMNLDDKTAQDVLNKSIQSGKQRYGVKDGKLYEFQPDNTGGWHGYPIKGTEAPTSVLKEFLKRGEITKPIYNKLIKGKE